MRKAKGSTEPTLQNIERGVQCRVSGRLFEKIIVGNGHEAGHHEQRVTGKPNLPDGPPVVHGW